MLCSTGLDLTLSHCNNGRVGLGRLLCCCRQSRWQCVSQSDELAAIIPGRFTYGCQSDSHNLVRDRVLVSNKGRVQKFDDRHLLFDPLHVVFAFVSGGMG